MNGKRCKALRRAVKQLRGYEPAGMNIIEERPNGLVRYEQSEWRKIKKSYRRGEL